MNHALSHWFQWVSVFMQRHLLTNLSVMDAQHKNIKQY